MKKISVLTILSALILTGCGREWRFNRAMGLEKRGYYVEAVLQFDEFAKKNPADMRAPEALYEIGRVYQKKMKLYSAAVRYYSMVLDRYPQAAPWNRLAAVGMLNSPDYFPLKSGNFWIEGDSLTGGRNMRAEWTCQEVSSGTFRIIRKISAGSKLVATINRYFRKDSLQLCESPTPGDAACTILYSFPMEKGREWASSRDKREIKLKLVDTDISLKVKAGEFNGCIKISEEYAGLPGSKKYNYYAPDVGWVLTTTSSSSGQEFRNTELVSYKIFPEE